MSNSNVGGKGVVEITTPKSYLQNKIIKVKPVLRPRALFIVGTDNKTVNSERIWLTGTSRSIICPKYDNGRFVNPLTYDEQMFLEKALGVSLDVNKAEECYLSQIRIQVVKTSQDMEDVFTELDLSTPMGYLEYKICLVSPEVATSKSRDNLYTPEQWFYLEDIEIEVTTERNTNKVEDECLKFLYTIEEKKNKLFDFLRTYNYLNKTKRNVDRGTSTQEWIYNEIKDLIKSKDTRNNVHDLVELIKRDPVGYELKLLIQDALSIGEIRYDVSTNGYVNNAGESVGSTFKDIEDFFRNPSNQLKKEHIKSQIQLQLK